MASVRFVPSRAGFRALMNSEAVQRALLERGERIAGAARESTGVDGFEADVRPGRNRAHCLVKTTTLRAAGEEHDSKAIERSIDAGR